MNKKLKEENDLLKSQASKENEPDKKEWSMINLFIFCRFFILTLHFHWLFYIFYFYIFISIVKVMNSKKFCINNIVPLKILETYINLKILLTFSLRVHVILLYIYFAFTEIHLSLKESIHFRSVSLDVANDFLTPAQLFIK